MPVHFDKIKGRWRFRFRRRVDGVRYQLTKLLPEGWSRAQAEAYDRKEGGRLYAETAGVDPARLPLAGAVQLYLDHRCPKLANGKKAAQDLAHMIDLIEKARLDQVSEVFQKHCEANPHLSDATLRNRGSYLKAAVRYARKKHGYGKGLADPTEGMDLPTPDNKRQVYAKLPELGKLWKAMDDEPRALFTLVFYLGLRWRAELLTRKPEHIERNGGDVWLEIGRTKNGQRVMKYVHPAAVGALDFIPFPHGDSFYYDRWHEATAAIGRPDLLPHDLRHSLGSEVISRPNASLDDVRAALHHTSVQSAQRYAHLYPEAMKRILAGTGGTSRKRVRARKRKSKIGGQGG